MTERTLQLLATAALAVTFVVLVVSMRTSAVQEGTIFDPTAGIPGPPVAAPPLQLTTSDGVPFNLQDHLGRPALVFFGFSSAPMPVL
jgi:cytochrome oxidase Cu insertion factor (SCO1/SenC/PrrC family)